MICIIKDQKRRVFIVGSGCLYMPMHSVIPLNAVLSTGKVMRLSDTANCMNIGIQSPLSTSEEEVDSAEEDYYVATSVCS